MTLIANQNQNVTASTTMTTSNKSYSFDKPSGKINIKKIDNVLTKSKEKFKKYTVRDWGDILLTDKQISNILMTDKANNVAETDSRFDPAVMGVLSYMPLGAFFHDEEYQRYMETANEKRLLGNFDLKFFTCVFCIKFTDANLNVIDNQLEIYANTIDGWHHLIALYLELRAGNIKGWDPEDWEKFPVPTQTWTTSDPTFPGRLALMLNGEGQSAWGEFEYLRIHSNNARLYPQYATSQDKLAYDQVMACIKEGNSVPIGKNHKDAKKEGVITHIGAIVQDANKDISRLKFIMSQNENWWPLEKRSSAMFGLYGNIYDEFVRNGKPLKGSDFDEQMLAYNYIIQHVFGSLDKAMSAIAGKKGALKKLEILSNQGWKAPNSDNALLAVVEIIYKDYLNGKERISAARGSYVYTNTKKQQINVVDALRLLPNTNYAQLIDTL